MKQAIIVRKDLKMSCGKIAGQVAHASVRAVISTSTEDNVIKWFKEGETKVVLKVKSAEELTEVMNKCIKNEIEFVDVHDLGKTQLEPHTLTTIGIGPYPDEVIDEVVNDLKLL